MSFSAFAGVELKVGIRSRTYPLYMLVALFYGLILRAVPEAYKITSSQLLLFMEPALVGFMFVGALILFEKKDGVLSALAVSPAEFRNYYWAKTLLMAFLSIIAAVVMIVIGVGVSTRYFYAFWGVLLSSIVYTLIGVGLVAKHKSLDDYFIVLLGVLIISILPFLGFHNIIENDIINKILYIIPSYSSIYLLRAGFVSVAMEKIIFSSAYLLIWIPISYHFAKIRFYKYAVEGAK